MMTRRVTVQTGTQNIEARIQYKIRRHASRQRLKHVEADMVARVIQSGVGPVILVTVGHQTK